MINILSNKFCHKVLFFLCILLVSVNCSSDNDEKVSEVASVVNLSLKKYYNEKGLSVLPVWNTGENGAAFLANGGLSEVSYASPIQVGLQKSSFLFTFNAIPQSNVTLVGFYPSHLDITCENGTLKTSLPSSQNGIITPCMIGKGTERIDMVFDISLEQLYSTLYINVSKGNYSIKRITLKGNNKEKIAGNISVDIVKWSVNATEDNIVIDFETPLDCSSESQAIAMMVAPVTLSNGYTVELLDMEDNALRISTNEPVNFEMGSRIYTEGTTSTQKSELIFCGSNMVYMIDAALANESTYKDAVTWSWDARSAATTLGIAESRCSNLDDCKPIDNNKRLLVTSSYNWMVLLDVETEKILFYSTNCPNAHSAEMLPSNRIAVACSSGEGDNNNKIQIYDQSRPNQVLYQSDLPSAHGVVWNNQTQRLYAVGSNLLQIYELKDWDTSTPYIQLEKTINTPQNSLHDLTLVNSNTLCLAGKKAYLYDIGANSFTEMEHFRNATSLKSVNYNADTNEVWYTDATIPEGTQTWSTQTIRYATDKNASATERTIKVPDINMYKVRVKSW